MRDRDGHFFLCDRQREILDFVVAFIAECHFSPTTREIVAATSITSTSMVNYHLNILQREGYVAREPFKPRTLTVIRQWEREPGIGL